jgi:hypothetical protein
MQGGRCVVTLSTFNVIITRLDKSMYRYSARREQHPRRGDILETVVDGRLVKAEVEMILPPVVTSSGTWTVRAEEI